MFPLSQVDQLKCCTTTKGLSKIDINQPSGQSKGRGGHIGTGPGPRAPRVWPGHRLLRQVGALNGGPFVLLRRGCKFGARNEFSGSEGKMKAVLFFLLGPSFMYLEHPALPLSKY